MSDDEEVIYKKKQNTIHYGSLEESERLRQQLEDIGSEDDDYEPEKKKPAIGLPSALQPATNIHISSDYFDLEQEV